MKQFIQTQDAPAAIGTYSQAVKYGKTVYASGQIGVDSAGKLVEGFKSQAKQVFANLNAIAEAAGGRLQDFVKLNVYLADLKDFAAFNEVMAECFVAPYPARATIEVSRLPKEALIEIEGIIIVE